ncbi:hypothetical protein, partial [Rhizobium sp.]|uniref:hypothetical protein n=1 Tax=Rhizobium sp. TaxID=391 RepID=UPI002F1070A8
THPGKPCKKLQANYLQMTLGSFADLFASEYPSNVEMIEIAPKDNRDFLGDCPRASGRAESLGQQQNGSLRYRADATETASYR